MLWRLCAIRSSCEPSGRGGRSAAIRRNRAWNSSFVARSSSLCEINLMISFVSSHGHRGPLGTEERRRRLAEAGVRRKPRLEQSRRGAFVGKVKDVDGCELKRMKLGRCEFQGRPWRVRRSRRAILTPRCFIPPKPLGVSAIRYLSLSRRANRLGSRSGVAPQVLWIRAQAPPRNHPSAGVAYRNVRIVSFPEPGLRLRRQVGCRSFTSPGPELAFLARRWSVASGFLLAFSV